MKKLLLAYQISGQTISVDIQTWNTVDLNGNEPFITINDGDIIPTNYIEISSIENWLNFGDSSENIDNVIEQVTILANEIGIGNLTSTELTLISDQTQNTNFGSDYISFSSNTSLITFSTSYVNYLTGNTSLLDGTYKIGWSLLWSHDSSSNDFMCKILLNNETIEEYIIEPQDSGGVGVGGTNQRMPLNGFVIKKINAGSYDLKIQLATNSSSNESTIYNSYIEIYRIK